MPEKNDKRVKKTKKKLEKLQIILKIADLKILKTLRYIQKLCSNLNSNSRGGFVAIEVGETKILTKKFKKLKKLENAKKTAKVCDKNCN